MIGGSINAKYTTPFSTERESFVGSSTIKKAYQEYLTNQRCHIQPLSSELSQGIPGDFGKNWLMFCPVLDIQEGDKVIIESKGTFDVSGVETFDFSMNPHCEIILRKFKS